MRVILHTRPGGQVAVTRVLFGTHTQLAAWPHLVGGGGFPLESRDWEIHKHVTFGKRPEAVAVRFVDGLLGGGMTDAEAYGVMADMAADHDWTAPELVDEADIPVDRWFRNAWTRGHNGGPIEIDIERARPIQWQRITDAIDLENARRRRVYDWRGGFLDAAEWKHRVAEARSLRELRVLLPVAA